MLGPLWGVSYGEVRIRDRIFRAPTLEEAEKEARAWHAEGEAVIETILKGRTEARKAREEQRRATIAASHARPGSIVIPT